ncbi:hypothetical protein G6O67_006690 [Ophiocordyceps sinensis]|uniref:Subtilisin-like protease n=1 Tax=Ophiocordyceps sinensis TaxID=72228 RepID=A0A8H4LW60_9HYPO|nr:hypothetical protein G6O67_006690 [Ophiocordyceps sinensis]
MHSALLLALLPLALAAPSKRATPAPLLVPRNAQAVEGKYIVRMKDHAKGKAVASAISAIAADADFTYSHCFQGFAAAMTAQEVEKLRGNPDVDYIEKDTKVTLYATQADADWGLARLSNDEANGGAYSFDDSAGEGTCAYIIDTGIDASNPEFEGRARLLANYADQDDTDGNGHGTHVSGTIGSRTYGVAKKTTLFGVKVLDANGSGQNSGIIAGMEFVVKDVAGQHCPRGVVVNMSLGGGFSETVNAAAANMVSAGLFLAVAAGNDGQDAAGFSPASERSACTVGATTESDSLATYSNVGAVVDVLAPGTAITSTWIGGQVRSISGTSMATPHVAGLAAYFLGTGQRAEGLCELMAQTSLKDVVSGVPSGTANLLINNAFKKGESRKH